MDLTRIVKPIALIVAAILFLIAALSDSPGSSWPEMIGFGLLLVAIALLVEEIPALLGGASGTTRRTDTTR